MDLFITGCATDFYVDAIVHSALNRDYNVVVVKDCHTSPHLSAKKVIQHHNWLWENMMPTNGGNKIDFIKGFVKKVKRHLTRRSNSAFPEGRHYQYLKLLALQK